MKLRVPAALAVVALLGGCATRLDRADIRHVSTATTQRLACPFRLAQVVDARSSKEAGMLGGNAFSFSDITTSIREALQVLGWSTAVDAPGVTVTIQKLYLGGQNASRMGVAAFSVQTDGQPAFVVRGQAAEMNWIGSEASAQGVLSEAVDEARSQLASTLNRSCR